jgi:hypothetical protein
MPFFEAQLTGVEVETTFPHPHTPLFQIQCGSLHFFMGALSVEVVIPGLCPASAAP